LTTMISRVRPVLSEKPGGIILIQASEKTAMGIRFQCPNGHPLNVKAYLAGRRGICPQCDARFIVPAASGQRAVPADQQPEAPRPPPAATPESIPDPPNPAPLWYTRSESGQQFGPVETGVIRQWMVDGRVSAHSWVWRTGWPEWIRAGEAFVEMLTRLPAVPPDTSASGLPPGPTQVPITTSSRQPVTLTEPALAAAPALPPAAGRRRTGNRKKRQLQITIGLALAVVLLTVALLWVMLQ
jgi:hypothetical protein